MKVEISPAYESSVGMPFAVSIKETSAKPEVSVKGVGTYPVTKKEAQYIAQVWFQKEGEYTLIVSDKQEVFQKKLQVYPKAELSFTTEFGFLSITVIVFLVGVLKWAQMKKKN